MATPSQLKKQGQNIYPVTHVDCVVDDNGNSIETLLNTKQDTLVSGTNIKTINSTSILGSGNIAVQPTLVSGTNIL